MRINHPTKNANELGPAWQNIAVKRQKENGLELFRSRKHFKEIKQPITLNQPQNEELYLSKEVENQYVCHDLSV